MTKTVLAIETTLSGGSLSIVRGELELAGSQAGEKISRAELLFQSLEELLERASVSKDELDLIAVSDGEGSFTGLRIGLAVAAGLKRSLGCGLVTVSVLKALRTALPASANGIIAVSDGRKNVIWSSTDAADNQRRTTVAEFTDTIGDIHVFCDRELGVLLEDRAAFGRISIFEKIPAYYLALAAESIYASDNDTP